MDYAKLAQKTAEHGLGETILVGSPKPWAAAIMRARGTVVGAIVVALPSARNSIGQIVQAMDAWASNRGVTDLFLDINAADWQSVQWLLGNGFSVRNVRLRMLLKGEYTCPDGLDMSRWGM